MLARSESDAAASAEPPSPADARASAPHAMGLLAASLFSDDRIAAAVTFVAELDDTAIARVRREALRLHARDHRPLTVELRYVADQRTSALIASLDDLVARGIRVVIAPVGGTMSELAPPAPTVEPRAVPEPTPVAPVRPSSSPARAASDPERIHPTSPLGPDPFGLDHAVRARAVPFLRFMLERYWRIEVTGIEHVPTEGPSLIVANHSGAVPADAFMLATALELRHPRRRCLRVLYDKFVDDLPLIGDLYRRLGAVRASLANAELLLRRGELVGLFPEGIAGVEKLCTERYRLRPFKTGTARLSVRTGSPIVPVAIVGAEEAYPVIARLYRVGRLVGLPWIPVTPTFPLCGVAGGLPLPTRWAMHFGPPIEPPPPDARSEEERVTELTARIRAAVEVGLQALLAKRVGIFV